MAAEAGRERQAGERRHLRDHGHGVRRRIDAAAPALRDLQAGERRVRGREQPDRLRHELRVRQRIEDARPLEGRGAVEAPGRPLQEIVEEGAADPHLQAGAPLPVGRQELAGVAEEIRRDLDGAAAPHGEREAAVQPLPGADALGAERAGPDGRAGGRPAGGRVDEADRQVDPVPPAEQRRPRPAGEQHGLRADAAGFRDDGRDAAGRGLEAAGRAALVDGGAVAPREMGERRHGPRGLGLPVARRPQPRDPALPVAGEPRRELVALQDRRMDLVLAGAVRPGLPARQVVRVVRAEEHALAAEAAIGALGLRLVPEPQALARQRDLLRRPALLAAPAPVPAGLLGADAALLDDRDLQALAGERQGGRHADHAAADDDDFGGLGQGRVARDGIEGRRHQVA